MKSSIISSIALSTLASAAPAILSRRQSSLTGTALLQFEFDDNVFTSDTEITIGSVIDTDLELLSIRIPSTEGVADPSTILCEAREQSTVVGTFTVAVPLEFPEAQTVTSISCRDTSRAPITSTSTATPSTQPQVSPQGPSSNGLPVAVIELEIEPNTFVQNERVTVGATADTEVEAISARIARVEGSENDDAVVCRATADRSSRVAGEFTVLEPAVFNDGELEFITSITCEDTSA